MKLLELYNEVLENPVTFTTFDDDGRVTISAMVGRTNVGYIIVEQITNGYWIFKDDISEDEYYEIFPDDSFLKIEHLLVFDDYKSGGYGKQLVNKAIEYGKEIGENIIYLNASPMGSSGLSIGNLVNFYKGFGFKTLPHSEKWANNKEMVLNLSSTINESETNNTSCLDKFGKELFGDQFGGHEKNTRLEDEYVKLINQFGAIAFGQGIDPKFISAMVDLKKCMSTFPDVLINEPETIYRGSNMPLSFFIKNRIKISEEPVDYTYNPRTIVQSWTPNIVISKIFSKPNNVINKIGSNFIEYHKKGLKAEDKFFTEILTKPEYLNAQIPIIYITQSNESEFLFKHKYFNELTKTDEDELIRVSMEPIKVKLKVDFSHLSPYAKKFANSFNDILEYGLDNGNEYRPNINEGIVKTELVDIDDDDLYDSLDNQANTLRSTSEISFGSADPFEILYDDETGHLVGATWIETSGAFSPHMIINPKYRNMGLSKQLIDGVVEKYKKMKQLRGDNYTFMLNVVNSSLANTMEKHYGFKKVSKDPHGNITMTL